MLKLYSNVRLEKERFDYKLDRIDSMDDELQYD